MALLYFSLFVVDLALAYLNRNNKFVMACWVFAAACFFCSGILRLNK